MRIGIIETGQLAEELRPRFDGYFPMFEALLRAEDPEVELFAVSPVKGEPLGEITDADGWIVTGSRHAVYDDLPWIEPLKAFLRGAVERGVPVVGICFGHQILAEAMGGRVEKFTGGWGAGVHEYRLDRRLDWMEDAPGNFAVRAMHQDQVVEMPAGATRIASSDFCPYAALVYGEPEAPVALTVQPHPEFSREFMETLIEMRSGKIIPTETAEEGLKSLERPVDNALWARWMLRVLRDGVARRNSGNAAQPA